MFEQSLDTIAETISVRGEAGVAMNMNSESMWFSVEQVAVVRGVSAKVVEELCAKGVLPARREHTPQGEVWRIHRDACEPCVEQMIALQLQAREYVIETQPIGERRSAQRRSGSDRRAEAREWFNDRRLLERRTIEQ
jgi:hypothetical protein